jgi:hypothetical protein
MRRTFGRTRVLRTFPARSVRWICEWNGLIMRRMIFPPRRPRRQRDDRRGLTRRIGAGFFGGEGFILQRIEGDGLAFRTSRAPSTKCISAGESLRVDTVSCRDGRGIDYDIEMVPDQDGAVLAERGFFSRRADQVCAAPDPAALALADHLRRCIRHRWGRDHSVGSGPASHRRHRLTLTTEVPSGPMRAWWRRTRFPHAGVGKQVLRSLARIG